MEKAKYTIKDSKRELVDSAIEYLHTVCDGLEMMKGGKAESAVCRELNISKDKLRRLIFSEKLGYDYKPIAEKAVEEGTAPDIKVFKEHILLSWQEEIFTELIPNATYLSIPPDINESMEFVLNPGNNFLKERECKIIRMIHEEHMTFGECGKVFGVTTERIRQVYLTGLRKMRHGRIMKYLMYGIPYITLLDKLRQQQYASVRDKELVDLEQKFNGIAKINNANMARMLLKEVETYVNTHYPAEGNGKVNIPLEAVDLSQRAYTVLKRSCINTLGEVAALDKDRLMGIRNMGRKTFEEIVEKLHQYGMRYEGEKEDEKND